MSVQIGFFMWPIVNVDHLHILILKCQLVMSGLDLGGVLCEANVAERQAQ